MKKIYIKSFIALVSGTFLVHSSLAQSSIANAEAAPNLTPSASVVNPSPNALFDIQWSFNPDSLAGVGSIAGVVCTGTEIWCSAWNRNAVYRFTLARTYIDSFQVTGVSATSGVRAMTFDGTNVWASYNSSTIKKINPVTRAVLATVTMPALTGSAGGTTAVRWVTYDPSLNGGAGGFWLGNFDTDIVQVDTTGTVLNTIPNTTHTLTAMYGAAYDNLSPGGPYLWVNSQTDPINSTTGVAFIVQLNATTGMPTGVQHDVDADFGTTGGIAGGIWAGIIPGNAQGTILSNDQGVQTAAYELTLAGLQQHNQQDMVNVHPNPSNGVFTVVNKSNIKNADLVIANAKGETVFTKHFDNFISEKVDARPLAKGVYMIMISNMQGKITKTMVIE